MLNRCDVHVNPAETGTLAKLGGHSGSGEGPTARLSSVGISIYPFVTPASGAGHITLGNIIHC